MNRSRSPKEYNPLLIPKNTSHNPPTWIGRTKTSSHQDRKLPLTASQDLSPCQDSPISRNSLTSLARMKSYNTYMTKTTLTGSPISKQIRMVLYWEKVTVYMYIFLQYLQYI